MPFCKKNNFDIINDDKDEEELNDFTIKSAPLTRSMFSKINSLDLKFKNNNKIIEKFKHLNNLPETATLKQKKNLSSTTILILFIVQLVLTSLTILSAFYIHLSISDAFKIIEKDCTVLNGKIY